MNVNSFQSFGGFRFLTLQISFLSVGFRFLTLQISFHFVGFNFLTLQISFHFVEFRFLTLQISLDFVFVSFRFVSFRFSVYRYPIWNGNCLKMWKLGNLNTPVSHTRFVDPHFENFAYIKKNHIFSLLKTVPYTRKYYFFQTLHKIHITSVVFCIK